MNRTEIIKRFKLTKKVIESFYENGEVYCSIVTTKSNIVGLNILTRDKEIILSWEISDGGSEYILYSKVVPEAKGYIKMTSTKDTTVQEKEAEMVLEYVKIHMFLQELPKNSYTIYKENSTPFEDTIKNINTKCGLRFHGEPRKKHIIKTEVAEGLKHFLIPLKTVKGGKCSDGITITEFFVTALKNNPGVVITNAYCNKDARKVRTEFSHISEVSFMKDRENKNIILQTYPTIEVSGFSWNGKEWDTWTMDFDSIFMDEINKDITNVDKIREFLEWFDGKVILPPLNKSNIENRKDEPIPTSNHPYLKLFGGDLKIDEIREENESYIFNLLGDLFEVSFEEVNKYSDPKRAAQLIYNIWRSVRLNSPTKAVDRIIHDRWPEIFDEEKKVGDQIICKELNTGKEVIFVICQREKDEKIDYRLVNTDQIKFYDIHNLRKMHIQSSLENYGYKIIEHEEKKI